MKLVTYLREGAARVGVLTPEGGAVRPLPYPDMNTLIETASLEELRAKAGEPVPLAEVRLLPPIPRPRQDVICLGMNYRAHLEEAADYNAEAFAKERPVAVYFSKRVTEAVTVWTGKVFSIPLSLLQEMAGKKVTLAVQTGYSLTFSITGTQMRSAEEGIRMTLASCGSVPEDVKMKLLSRSVAAYEFSMEEKAGYPCTVNVHMNFGAENAGKTAVLYYYDETLGTMRFAGAFKVTERGDAVFGLSRGDEYIAVIADGNTYTVAPGDTLSGIASGRGMTLRSLLLANPQIRDADRIRPGQILVIL